MASTEESSFRRSASAAAPESPAEHLDKESEGQILRGRRSAGVNCGLLNIDLNAVPPPEDGGSESPAMEIGFEFGEIESRFSKGEIAEEGAVAVTVTVTGSGEGENMRRWDALLEASSNALRDYEEKARNRMRRPSREAETGGGWEARKGAGRIRKRGNGGNGHSLAEIHAAAATAPVVVARSTRERAVAMPSKYKDSVLDAAAVVVEGARSSRRRYG